MSLQSLISHGVVGGGASQSVIRTYTKQIANLTAIADIYERVPSGAQAVLYDLFDASNNRSAGLIDSFQSTSAASISAGATQVTLVSVTGLSVGMEVTVQDATNKEAKVIQAINGLQLTFTSGTTNAYAAGFYVYRSLYSIAGGKLKIGNVTVPGAPAKVVTANGNAQIVTSAPSRAAKTQTAYGTAKITNSVAVRSAKTVTPVSTTITGGAKSLSVEGTTKISTAQSVFGGSSALFDGSGPGIIAAQTYPDFNISGDYTWETRIRFNAINQYQYICSMGYSSTYTIFYIYNHTVRWQHQTSGVYNETFIATPGTNFVTGQWYHIAVIRTGNTNRMFLDGVQIGSDFTTTHTPEQTDVLRIGTMDGTSYALNGYMDEFRVSNVARWTSNFTVPTSAYTTDANTKLLLHFDGANNSTTIIDSSVSGPKFGTGMGKFTGTNTYLSIPDSNDWAFGGGDFTFRMFVNFTSLPGVGDTAVFLCQYQSDTYMYKFGLYNMAGQYKIRMNIIQNAVDIVQFYSDPVTVTTGTWYHVEFVRDNNNYKAFLDGVLAGTGSVTAMPDFSGAMQVGTYNGNAAQSFIGYMDDLEIAKGIARHTTNFTPPTSPLVNDQYTALLLHFDGTEGSTTFTDDGTGIAGKFGTGAGLFNGGTSDYVTSPATSDWNFGTGDFTIRFWAKFNALPTSGGMQGLISSYWGSTNWYRFALINSGGTLQLKFEQMDNSSTTISLVNNTGTLTTSTWYHIEMVKASNVYKMFINGTQIGTDQTNTATIYTNSSIVPFYVGTEPYSNTSINGLMDDLEIAKGIARHTANFTPPAAALTGDAYTKLLLHFEGATNSTTFTDDNYGPPVLGTGAGYFDGVGSYLTTPDDSGWFFDTGDFTIRFWLNLTALPTSTNSHNFVGQFTDVSNYWLFRIYNNVGSYELNFLSKLAGTGVTAGITWSTPVLNTWNHIEVTRASGTLRIFVNGTQIGSQSYTSSIPNLAGTLLIGQYNSSSYLNGYMDELEIANGIARHTANFTPPATALTADQYTTLLLHMDGINGSTTFTDSNLGFVSSPVLSSDIRYNITPALSTVKGIATWVLHECDTTGGGPYVPNETTFRVDGALSIVATGANESYTASTRTITGVSATTAETQLLTTIGPDQRVTQKYTLTRNATSVDKGLIQITGALE